MGAACLVGAPADASHTRGSACLGAERPPPGICSPKSLANIPDRTGRELMARYAHSFTDGRDPADGSPNGMHGGVPVYAHDAC